MSEHKLQGIKSRMHTRKFVAFEGKDNDTSLFSVCTLQGTFQADETQHVFYLQHCNISPASIYFDYVYINKLSINCGGFNNTFFE